MSLEAAETARNPGGGSVPPPRFLVVFAARNDTALQCAPVFARLRSAAFVGLIAFHGLLLWQRCADATILEPAVLAKYVASLLLLVAARLGHRLIPAHLLGRRAQMVFWLLVIVLHAVAPVGDVNAEIAAIIEISLGLPLAVAIAAVALAAPPRQLIPLSSTTCAARSFREHVSLPARAPPFAR